MLQQVYNTAREQQENSKRYSKRYSKFIRYSLLILFINTLNTRIHSKINFTVFLFKNLIFSFLLRIKTILRYKQIIPVSSLGLVWFALAPWSDLHIRPGAFLISHKLYCNDKKKQDNSDKKENDS